MRIALSIVAAACISACSSPGPDQAAKSPAEIAQDAPDVTQDLGRLVDHEQIASAYVQPRRVSVWLPPDYDANTDETYPVIYAHDGQNLFDPAISYGGVEWGLDETASHMMSDGTVRPAIIVGIWNTNERWQEYAPQKAFEHISWDAPSEWLGDELPALKGDAYLRFIVEELKPFVDETYRTRSGPEDTMIMGSSMGGLISLYAAGEYPGMFGKVAAVSIHWPLAEPDGAISAQADHAMQAYLASSGIDPARHTIWFDRGTETLDATYAPHAAAMQSWFREQGWSNDRAMFRIYPGTDHSEGAWAARADEILTFLLSE